MGDILAYAAGFLVTIIFIAAFDPVYQMIKDVDHAAVCYRKNVILRIFIFRRKIIKPLLDPSEEIGGAFSVRVRLVHSERSEKHTGKTRKRFLVRHSRQIAVVHFP